jgi:hypothetical protein
MGLAGWRFAHVKRNLSGRAAVIAVLEDWLAICSVVVAVGSMIMIGQRLAAVTTAGERLALDAPCFPGRSELRLYDFTLCSTL